MEMLYRVKEYFSFETKSGLVRMVFNPIHTIRQWMEAVERLNRHSF